MITQGITGRRIVAVWQSRTKTNAGVKVVVDAIILDNGKQLIPFAYECEDSGPIGDVIVRKRKHTS